MYAVYTSLFICIVFYYTKGHLSAQIFIGIILGFACLQLINETKKIKKVEFDEEFLYVIRRREDLVIPLENIESVEISTLGGVYKINLYSAEQLGKDFYFKPSLLYPLNYKKKDALVNMLRKNIEVAKRKKQTFPLKALMS